MCKVSKVLEGFTIFSEVSKSRYSLLILVGAPTQDGRVGFFFQAFCGLFWVYLALVFKNYAPPHLIRPV